MTAGNGVAASGNSTAVQRLLGWAVPATPQDRAAALWSFAYFFALLAGYYVLRPLRDQMGIAGGVKNLPWLFTATFVTLIVVQPIYGALVAKLPRSRFIQTSARSQGGGGSLCVSGRRKHVGGWSAVVSV